MNDTCEGMNLPTLPD